MVLMLAGAWAARTSNVGTAIKMDGIAAAAGAWLIIASFILGNPIIAAGLWNDIIVGGIVVILGAWSAAGSRLAGAMAAWMREAGDEEGVNF